MQFHLLRMAPHIYVAPIRDFDVQRFGQQRDDVISLTSPLTNFTPLSTLIRYFQL